jgi:LPXTG-motif cell wall-anchored protein
MSEAQAAHKPAADDGDCTTAITCSNEGCKVVTTPAKAAHTPAADDGDCTTDIKCSVCGKTTTAGEAAHKYTDKNDTTCDNAGCTNTRKVEGTENPKTGDNSAIAVVAALMVTAAAAFVTTKKFAR